MFSRYELKPVYDSRKSFYGKATVNKEFSRLWSYNTLVVEVSKNGTVKLLPAWDHSQTTLRHVKEFLLQSGFRAESKKQLIKDYVEG